MGWVVLQHLSLPHPLVAQFSPVKTGKGGMHKKLCVVHWTNIDLEGLSEQLFSFVLRRCMVTSWLYRFILLQWEDGKPEVMQVFR